MADLSIVSNEEGWELVLVVDVHEWSRNEERKERFHTLLQERLPGRVIVKALPVGDYIWLVRYKGGQNNRDLIIQQEDSSIVLDYIVERKTSNNIIQSIYEKSIRYAPYNQLEIQLYKMEHSGITDRVLLHEKCSLFVKGTKGLMDASIKKIKQMQGFSIEQTNDMEDTVNWMVRRTRKIEQNVLKVTGESNNSNRLYHLKDPSIVQNSPLTFENLKENVKKGLSRPEFTWELKLLSLKGLGREKIKPVLAAYPTQSSLKSLFHKCESKQKFLKEVGLVEGVGKKIAEEIWVKLSSGDWRNTDDDDDNDFEETRVRPPAAVVVTPDCSSTRNNSVDSTILKKRSRSIFSANTRLSDLMEGLESDSDCSHTANHSVDSSSIQPKFRQGQDLDMDNTIINKKKRPRSLFAANSKISSLMEGLESDSDGSITNYSDSRPRPHMNNKMKKPRSLFASVMTHSESQKKEVIEIHSDESSVDDESKKSKPQGSSSSSTEPVSEGREIIEIL